MKIIIIEDEAPAAKRIEKLILEVHPDTEIMAKLDSIESVVSWLNTNSHPDLALMDIELADGQSFEIFNQVKILFPVIFCTAYDEFALKAFKVNSIDYLLKPIETDALKQAIDKFKQVSAHFAGGQASSLQEIQNLIQSITQTPKKNYKSRFLIKIGDKFQHIDCDQIAYFLSEEKTTFIYTHEGKKYIIDNTLDELENLLDPIDYYRLNRQFIVHFKSIQTIHSYFNGKLKVNLVPDPKTEVIVSREKASVFKDWLDS